MIWFTGVHILSRDYIFWRCQFAVIGSFNWFTGGFLASDSYILMVGMSFHRFAHKQ